MDQIILYGENRVDVILGIIDRKSNDIEQDMNKYNFELEDVIKAVFEQRLTRIYSFMKPKFSQELINFWENREFKKGSISPKFICGCLARWGEWEKAYEICEDWNHLLKYASGYGSIENVKYIVKKGVNNFDEALAWATNENNLDIIKYLIEECGANNNGGVYQYCVSTASSYGYLDIVKYFLDVAPYLIHIAQTSSFSYDQLEVCQYLIFEKNILINEWNTFGCGPKIKSFLIKNPYLFTKN